MPRGDVGKGDITFNDEIAGRSLSCFYDTAEDGLQLGGRVRVAEVFLEGGRQARVPHGRGDSTADRAADRGPEREKGLGDGHISVGYRGLAGYLRGDDGETAADGDEHAPGHEVGVRVVTTGCGGVVDEPLADGPDDEAADLHVLVAMGQALDHTGEQTEDAQADGEPEVSSSPC